MSYFKYLNRFQITGNPSTHMPMCVLQEIANSHGVVNPSNDYNTLTRQISFHPVKSAIPSDLSLCTQSDMIKLAKFINSRAPWDNYYSDDNPLLLAYQYYLEFKDSIDIGKLNLDIVGLPTPEQPRSLSPSMLYSVLGSNQVYTSQSDTLKDMVNKVELLLLPDKILHSSVTKSLANIDKKLLLSIISSLKISVETRIEMDWQKLTTTFNQLQSQGSPIVDDYTAIVSAFYRWKIDISPSPSPHNEYLSQGTSETYVPNCATMKEIIKLYGNSASLRFNSAIPVTAYQQRGDLRSLVCFEGYSDFEANSRDADLSMLISQIYIPPNINIFPGIEYPVSNQYTTLSENIHSLPTENLFSLGVYGGPYTIVSVNELLGVFTATGTFLDVSSKSGALLPPRIARKIINLCGIRHTPLVDKIKEILLSQISVSTSTNEIRSFSNMNKEKVTEVFMSLFKLGMYMRGYDGTGPYPLRGRRVDNQYEVDVLVTRGMQEFDSQLSTLPSEIATTIQNLPLVRYDQPSDSIRQSIEEEKGKTIQQRLDIVKSGFGVESCLRISSAWIIVSALYHMSNLGLPTPLDYHAILITLEPTERD